MRVVEIVRQKPVTPPVEKIVLEVTVEELRTIHACLAASTLEFIKDVGVKDGYPLFEKTQETLENIKAVVPYIGPWAIQC